MNPTWVLVLIGAITCAVNLAITLVTSTAVLSSGRAKLVADITTRMEARVEQIRQELDGDFRSGTHDVGESLSAMRTKVDTVEKNVKNIELWNRDNLVSKATFVSVIDEMKNNWRRFEDRQDQALRDIGKKLDRALGLSGSP